MNCREAHSQISAERDGALDNPTRVALNGHLAHCDACRRVRDNLASALTMWRDEVTKTAVPDAEREWHAVRRRIRGGSEAGGESSARPRRNFFVWLAIPLGAAAAFSVALFVSPGTPPGLPLDAAPQVARVDSVEAPGNNASTMVIVDDKSGWLIVWANDANPKSG